MACVRWRQVFDTLRSCKKRRPCHPLSLLVGGNMIRKWVAFERLCERHLWGRDFPSSRVNQVTKTREIGPTFRWSLRQLDIRLYYESVKVCIALMYFLCRFPFGAYACRSWRCCYLLVALRVRYLASGVWWIRWKKKQEIGFKLSDENVLSTAKFQIPCCFFRSDCGMVQTSPRSPYNDLIKCFSVCMFLHGVWSFTILFAKFGHH